MENIDIVSLIKKPDKKRNIKLVYIKKTVLIIVIFFILYLLYDITRYYLFYSVNQKINYSKESYSGLIIHKHKNFKEFEYELLNNIFIKYKVLMARTGFENVFSTEIVKVQIIPQKSKFWLKRNFIGEADVLSNRIIIRDFNLDTQDEKLQKNRMERLKAVFQHELTHILFNLEIETIIGNEMLRNSNLDWNFEESFCHFMEKVDFLNNSENYIIDEKKVFDLLKSPENANMVLETMKLKKDDNYSVEYFAHLFVFTAVKHDFRATKKVIDEYVKNRSIEAAFENVMRADFSQIKLDYFEWLKSKIDYEKYLQEEEDKQNRNKKINKKGNLI